MRPKLDPRRADDFRRELVERAAAWIPGWQFDEGAQGFGRALLDVAARFSAQVAERLDRAGEKLSLGLLDWLAVRGKAARPARVAVAFKLADNATEARLARHPVQLQATVDGANVVFETESDVRLVPGTIEALVGFAAPDSYYLPPPGLSSLEPLEPLPTQWRTKAFAAPGNESRHLLLDPALGLEPGMLIEAAGKQYAVIAVEGDLIGIDPPIDAAGGIARGAIVRKVTAFDPFGGAARDRQMHAVYLGDDSLFNLEAAAVIEVRGIDTKLASASWQYFGKASGDEVKWQDLKSSVNQGSDSLRLAKSFGSIEPTTIGQIKSRWIRAIRSSVAERSEILSTEALKVLFSPSDDPEKNAPQAPGAEATADGFANTLPLVLSNEFYPFGREPKLFDTFYLGSADAFSKAGASVTVHFELADETANSFAVLNRGPGMDPMLASIGRDRALHLHTIGRISGQIKPLLQRGSLRPGKALAEAPTWRPPAWNVSEAGAVRHYVGAAAKDEVWVWMETLDEKSDWLPFGRPASGKQVDALVYLDTSRQLIALAEGRLYAHSALKEQAQDDWTAITLKDANGAPRADAMLASIAPIRTFDGSPSMSPLGLVAVTRSGLVLSVLPDGICLQLDPNPVALTGTAPTALYNPLLDEYFHFFHSIDSPPELLAIHRRGTVNGVIARASLSLSTADFGPVQLAGGSLEAVADGAFATLVATGVNGDQSWIITWQPFDNPLLPDFTVVKVPDSSGPLGGAPSIVGPRIIVPGRTSDAWVAGWNPALRFRDRPNSLGSGIVVGPSAALAKDDVVIIDRASGSSPKRARLDTALSIAGGRQLFPLFPAQGSADDFAKLQPAAGSLILFRKAGPTLNGKKVAPAPNTLELDPGDVSTGENDWIRVKPTTLNSRWSMRKVTSRNVSEVTLDRGLPGAVNDQLEYQRGVALSASVVPYFRPTSASWQAVVPADLRGSPFHFGALSPRLQFGDTFEVDNRNHPTLIAFDKNWSAVPGLNQSFIFDASIAGWTQYFGGTPSAPELAWEYWNLGNWAPLKTNDATLSLRRTETLSFEVPATLAPTDVNGKTNHWIRARLIAGDYGREVVSVVNKPDPRDATATIQEVVRDATNLRPPVVIGLRIRYSIPPTPPAHLLTEDGGSTRNQSDANRSSDVAVEALVPLTVQLGRLEPQSSSTVAGGTGTPLADDSGTDCDCGGLSPSPSAAIGNSTGIDPFHSPLSNSPRSILIGLRAELADEPVNVLLLVEERQHENFAPLKVEALINDRFEPLPVSDRTRALGESEILSMSFAVKPSPRELFGQTLTWLRLSPTPSRSAVVEEWKPVIRGAYLNAAFASATETLTREALGSSDGRPHLSVRVARPPLLAGSLELRVREPLDDEECKRMIEDDPNSVKSKELDLPGHWVLWRQVDDPDDHGAGDRVYALDEASGTIVFGNGIHGMVPPIGRDAIVAFAYQRTEPPAAGAAAVPANLIAERTALQLVTPLEGVESVFAADHAAGGAPPEPDDRVLRFGSAGLRHRQRALVLQDFADIALASSPEIAQASALRGADGVRLVVVMRGAEPAPTAAQKRELQRLLQRAASPLLGERGAIAVVAPRVRRLRIAPTLRVTTLDDAGEVGDAARKAMTALFDTSDPARTGWPLGTALTEEDIAVALVDIPELEGFGDIRLFEISEDGEQQPWPATARADELVRLADDAFRITFEALEAQR